MPENFNMTIRIGNDAMQTPDEIARALRDIARKLDGSELEPREGVIFDVNGNDVGVWEVA